METAFNTWLQSNAGASAVSSTGPVTWTNDFSGSFPTINCRNDITVTFTASNPCGQTKVITEHFVITDSSPPFFTNSGSNAAFPCNHNFDEANAAYTNWLSSQGGLIASDACTPASQLGWYNNGPQSLWPGCNLHIPVTFTVFDPVRGCGEEF